MCKHQSMLSLHSFFAMLPHHPICFANEIESVNKCINQNNNIKVELVTSIITARKQVPAMSAGVTYRKKKI